PSWRNADNFADETDLNADAEWWTEFGRRFKDEPAILAWDLMNEPTIGWDTPAMRAKWNDWLKQRYSAIEKVASAWQAPAEQIGSFGDIAPPPPAPAPGNAKLLDFQYFREHIAIEWTRRMATAIRTHDKRHLLTIGCIQW